MLKNHQHQFINSTRPIAGSFYPYQHSRKLNSLAVFLPLLLGGVFFPEISANAQNIQPRLQAQNLPVIDIPPPSIQRNLYPIYGIDNGYFILIPAKGDEIAKLTEKIQFLGMPNLLVIPENNYIRVGKFIDRNTAEKWEKYFRDFGVNAGRILLPSNPNVTPRTSPFAPVFPPSNITQEQYVVTISGNQRQDLPGIATKIKQFLPPVIPVRQIETAVIIGGFYNRDLANQWQRYVENIGFTNVRVIQVSKLLIQ